MNKRKIITSALVVALTLAACQRNDDPGDGLRRQVDISATIDGHAQGVRTRAAMNPDGSGTFENGDKILLTHSINGNAPTMLDYTLGSSKLYWEDVVTDTYNAIHFGGWYPACHPEGNLSDPQPYDVAGAADDTHRDLLIAAQTSANYGAPVTLAFRHVMHKLTVNLKSGEHSAEQLAKAEVKLMGFKSHAGVHFPSGKVDAEEASGTDEYPTKKGASVSFIVAPQNLISGKPMLVIAIGNEAFVYEVPAKFTGCDDDAPCCLMSGKRLTLTLSLGSGQGGNTATLIEGGISAWDEQGSLDGTATEEGGGASAEQFPDPNFKAYVLKKFDTDKDGIISAEEASKVIQIGVPRKEIKNLKGIEIFTRLQGLDCDNNQLTELDLSKNTGLQVLSCDNNRLTELDLSKNTGLETLVCNENQLTELDLSKNTGLQVLSCDNNRLTELDLSKNSGLQALVCDNNRLTALDLSKNTGLETLACNENQLTALDLSKNTGLQALNCNRNQLTALNLSKNTGLKILSCGNNRLTALDITATQLLILWCGDQQNGQQLQLTLGNDHNRKRWKEQWKREGHRTVTAKDE